MIDTPPQLTSLLSQNGVDDRIIDNIFITHRHEDHTLGIRSILQGKSSKGFCMKNKVNLFMGRTMKESISEKFLSGKTGKSIAMETDAYRITTISTLETVSTGLLNVTALETNHLKVKNSEDECFGYMLENADGVTAVFLIDAPTRINKSTLNFLKNRKVDLLLTDCTFSGTGGESSHGDIKGAVNLKNLLAPSRMVISHIGHRNHPHPELAEITAAYGIETGFDGMIIELGLQENFTQSLSL